MKFPISETEIAALLSENKGKVIKSEIVDLIKRTVEAANKSYEAGMQCVMKGIKSEQTIPFDKNCYIETVKRLFIDGGSEFTESHKAFFEESVDFWEYAYEQGKVDG